MEVVMIDNYEYLRAIDPQEYFKQLSLECGIDIQGLVALDKNFHLVPRGQYAPDEGVALNKSLDDVATDVGLPPNTVRHLQQIGAISRSITYEDVDYLRRHRLVVDYEKGTVKPKRKKRPPVLQPELNEPWKNWVYLRYIANRISYKNDGQMMNPDKRIFVRSLAKEVEYRFGATSTPELRNQIKEIRTTAYNDKRKSREQDIPPEEVAIQRGIEQEAIRIFFKTQPIFAAGIQLTF
jgi:hypothetical protein